METLIYSVHDLKSQDYAPPFVAMNDEVATRMFGMLVSDPATLPGQFPEDYRLYRIGTFDSQSAVIESAVPVLVVDGGTLTTSLLNRMKGETNA